LAKSYNPHFNYDVNFAEGTIANTFALRIEPDAYLDFEWRDWSGGDYITGPHFGVRNRKLTGPNETSMDLPANQWVKIEIIAGIGNNFTGKWDLKVTVPGQTPRNFKGLPFAKPNFKKLTWIGFTSSATIKTAFYLDDFTVSSGK
jgi:hypothetical protein